MKVMHIGSIEAAMILTWFQSHENNLNPSSSKEYELAKELAKFVGLKVLAADHAANAKAQFDAEIAEELKAIGDWEPEPEPTPPEPETGQRVRSVDINVRQRKIKLNY